MRTRLETILGPAEFDLLKARDLSSAVCVVFDVLRASSTMVTALANGAAGIIPVEDIPQALAAQRRSPDFLLAGERDGVRIPETLTGGISFSFGNSPREFDADKVLARTIVATTTNGTRALRACAHAQRVLVGSFLNLSATATFVKRLAPPHLVCICSGTYEESAYEDVLGAGALFHSLEPIYAEATTSDATLMSLRLFNSEKKDLLRALSSSRNGRRLLSNPHLAEDVAFCAQVDRFPFAASLQNGVVRKELNHFQAGD